MNLLYNTLLILLAAIFSPSWTNPWFLGLAIASVLLFGAVIELIIWLVKRSRKKKENDVDKKKDIIMKELDLE